MKDEMNHLIEYYTVLKRAGHMIFGEEDLADKKLNFAVSKTDDPEENLLHGKKEKKNSDSEGSDDYLFGSGNSKYN